MCYCSDIITELRVNKPFYLSVIGRSQGYKPFTRLVLSLRTMCAYHSHHVCRASAQWQGVERKAYYGLSLLWRKEAY